MGTLELFIPQEREGRFQTQLFARYQRCEKVPRSIFMQDVQKGKEITEKLCGTSFPKSHISELTKNLDEKISYWQNRPLGKIPLLNPWCTVEENMHSL